MAFNSEVVNRIKLIPPETLEAHGVISQAKVTVNRQPTYICPFCGNGTGKDGDGLVVSLKNGIYTYTCFGGCGEKGYDNFHLLAAFYGLDSRTDFVELCNTICDEFGIYGGVDSDILSAAKNVRVSTPEIDSEELELIKADIANSRSNLKSFVDKQGGFWRGLSYETLEHFGCGFIGNWTSPKSRVNKTFSTPTPRIIIPSGNHYLARLTVDIDTFPDESRKFIKPKQHAGTKTTFNVERLIYNMCIAVEGEIDAMSIWQVSRRDVVATCGVGGFTAATEAFKAMEEEISVIILFDPDDAGRKNAAAFQNALTDAGINSFVAFLDDGNSKLDANQILTDQGADALKAKIDDIIFAASAVFSKASRASTRRKNSADTSDFIQSSKAVIPSCPVDILIPPDYRIGKFGVVDFKSRTIVTTPVVATKVFEPFDNEVAAVELAFYKRDSDSWRFITVNFSTIADNKKILALADFGITIVQQYAKFFSTYLMRLVDFRDNITIIPRVRLYGKPGWHGDAFISPYDADNSYTIRAAGVDYHKAFCCSGDKDLWLETFKVAISDSPVARLVCGAALAAPLLKICKLRSSQIHLACPSGNGKSAAVKLALSIYGDPVELYRTFNSTGNSILEWAAKFNSLPHGLDELQAASKREREKVDELIYQISGEQSRGRLARDGTLKPVSTFRTLRLSTGEQKLTSDSSGQGAIRRVLEITYPKIFSNDFASHVHELLDAGNFGFFGKDWIDFVTSKAGGIAALFAFFREHAQNFLPEAISDHLKVVALCYASLSAFNNFLDNRLDDVLKSKKFSFESDLLLLMQGIPDNFNSTNLARAKDALADYVFTHPAFFVTELANGDFATADKAAFEIRGVKFNDGSVGFFKTALRKILDECGFPSAEAVIRAFLDEGAFTGNPKIRDGQVLRCVDNSRKRSWVYVFNLDFLNLIPDAD